MIFETVDFYIELVKLDDISDVINVYDSNPDFLERHMDKTYITEDWLKSEIKEMHRIGFNACKIVDKAKGKIIGVLDFKVAEESYLSLLMLHNDCKSNGYGTSIYKNFEDYVKSKGSRCIRIDVVNDDNDRVMDFWIRNGFERFQDVKLNCTGKELSAVTMKKFLERHVDE